jgi:hypothetical protein
MTGCEYRNPVELVCPEANMPVVTEHNVEHVAEAFHKVILNT